MSENESKMVLRGRIKSLDGKSAKAAFEFFETRVNIKPDEYSPEDDELYYTRHDASENAFLPRRIDRLSWGIEYVFKNEGDRYYPDFRVSLENLNHIASVMSEVFEVDPLDISVQSYTWYNGTEEPVDF